MDVNFVKTLKKNGRMIYMDSIFLSLNGKPKLLRTGSGCPLVSLALARNTQKFSIKKPAALRAKLTDKKTGVGNAIQSLSREMN